MMGESLGVFSNSNFGQALMNGTLSLPQECPLPGTSSPNLPYAFVGDEAFPLEIFLLRPYPGNKLEESLSIFNYRLSRARGYLKIALRSLPLDGGFFTIPS